MAVYDSDLQAAVDATSVAKDAKATDDLAGYLREQLAEREIETSDDAWIQRVLEGIENDPNFMVADTPSDYDPPDRDTQDAQQD
jgi:hypothetical protein